MNDKPVRVLSFAPFGSHTVHNQLDAVLCAALRERGCEVLIALCDGIYPDCHTIQWENNKAEACLHCARKGQELFAYFGLPTTQLRQYIRPEDRQICQTWIDSLHPEDYGTAEWEGIPIGDWATPAVHSRFRVKSHDLSRPDIQVVHKQYLYDTLLSYCILQRLYDFFKPTHLIIWGAWLNAYRAAYELARKRGINVLAHEKFINEVTEGGTFSVESNTITALTHNPLRTARIWHTIPLAMPELEEVKNYYQLLEKEGGVGFYNFQTQYSSVRSKLGIPGDAKIVGIFTSSEYEVSTHPQYKYAPEQLEVINHLIRLFEGRGYYLVIRHHPNIGRYVQGRSETDLLSRMYDQAFKAPSCVRVIMPHERITTYALMWDLDIAISFYSTVSLEATSRGIPASTFDISLYRDAFRHLIGLDYQQGSLARVVDGLLDQEKDFSIEDLRKFYRYSHAVLFKFGKRFKSFKVKNVSDFDIRVKHKEELKPGYDPELDRICNHVLYGTSLERLPSDEEFLRKDDYETLFLSEELKRLKSKRQEIRGKSTSSTIFPDIGNIAVVRLLYQKVSSYDDEFKAWFNHSRYKKLALYESEIMAKDNISSTHKFLLQTLKNISEKWVLVTQNCFQYDESFISALSEHILDAQRKGNEIEGARFGTWIGNREKGIERALFTAEVKASAYAQALSFLPELNNPFINLGFGLYGREELHSFLTTLDTNQSQLKTAEDVYNFASRPQIDHLAIPLVIFWQNNQENCGSPKEKIDTNILVEQTIHAAQSQKYEEALCLFNTLIPLRQDLPMLYYGKAVVCVNLGKLEEARESLMESLRRMPKHSLSQNLLLELNNSNLLTRV